MGGPERIERQRQPASCRCASASTCSSTPARFVEYGLHAEAMDPGLAAKGHLAADGVVTGIGEVDGRRVAIIAYDFTVLAGSMGEVGERKTARMRELVAAPAHPGRVAARLRRRPHPGDVGLDLRRRRRPVPRAGDAVGRRAPGRRHARALRRRHRVHPRPHRLHPDGRGHVVDGPRRPPPREGGDGRGRHRGGDGRLGVHNKKSGVADAEVDIRRGVPRPRAPLPVVLPVAQPGAAAGRRVVSDPIDRRCEELYDIVPTAPRRAYDVRKVVAAVVDADCEPVEIKAGWARNVITTLARLGGQPVGIIANNPMVLGGALDVNAADKAAHFVWLCDAYGIPLVFLHDVPGFIVGTKVEEQGIIRHGAKFLFAVSEATVPKLSVVLRKSYGAGYFVMNGLAYECDHLSIWPTAEIAVMGPDGMVNITMRKHLEGFEEGKERDAERIRLAEEFRKNIDPWIAAGHAQVDDVIDPADTRTVLDQGAAGQPHEAGGPPLAQARRAARLTPGSGEHLPDGTVRCMHIRRVSGRRSSSARRCGAALRPGRRTAPPASGGTRSRLPFSTPRTTASASVVRGVSGMSCERRSRLKPLWCGT